MAVAIVAFQLASFAAFVSILAVVAALAWRRPETRLLLVFPAAWAVWGTALYLGVYGGHLSSDAVLILSASHRFLAAAGILAGLFALCLILSDDYDGDDS